MTQKELAMALHVAQPTVSKFEHGDDIRMTTLSKYLGAMGGGLRLTAVFDDEEVDLGLLKPGADIGFRKGGRRSRKDGRAGAAV